MGTFVSFGRCKSCELWTSGGPRTIISHSFQMLATLRGSLGALDSMEEPTKVGVMKIAHETSAFPFGQIGELAPHSHHSHARRATVNTVDTGVSSVSAAGAPKGQIVEIVGRLARCDDQPLRSRHIAVTASAAAVAAATAAAADLFPPPPPPPARPPHISLQLPP